MARFLRTGGESVRWVADHVPPSERVRLLGGMLFSVEGGLVDRRLRWGTGDSLRRMAELEVQGFDPRDVEEGLRLLRRDLPMLNEARRHVVASNSR